jgi:hypothetical protein
VGAVLSRQNALSQVVIIYAQACNSRGYTDASVSMTMLETHKSCCRDQLQGHA